MCACYQCRPCLGPVLRHGERERFGLARFHADQAVDEARQVDARRRRVQLKPLLLDASDQGLPGSTCHVTGRHLTHPRRSSGTQPGKPGTKGEGETESVAAITVEHDDDVRVGNE